MELHANQDDRVGGERFTGGSGPTVHERDRVCRHPQCLVRLSIYNGSDRCALHDRLSAEHGAPPRR